MENRARILIVDDDPEFTGGVQTRLATRNCCVSVTTDRLQAQELARHERPDLVILGTVMPRGDSFLLHQWLKHRPDLRDLPIVVVDSSPDKQLTRGWTRSEATRLEAEDYIRKPVQLSALEALVSKLLDKMTRRIKVLVADDHAVVREGIRALLSLQRDIQVVGEAVNGKEATEKTIQLLPDVVLMDIVMPVMNGLDATKCIFKECDSVKVLMLSQYDDDENVLASKQAGAVGFIPKRTASSDLLTAIRSAKRLERFQTSAH